MAQNNKPEDDAKAMQELYNKGVSINDIADKYNHTPYEVEQVVTNVAPAEQPKKDVK